MHIQTAPDTLTANSLVLEHTAVYYSTKVKKSGIAKKASKEL